MRQSEEHLSWKSELGEEKKETSSAWGTDYNLLYNTFASYLSPLHVHWVQTWGGIMYIQIQTWATKCWPASIFMQLCIPVTNFSRLLCDLQPLTSMWSSTFKLMDEKLQGGISKPPIFTVLLDYLTKWTFAWMAADEQLISLLFAPRLLDQLMQKSVSTESWMGAHWVRTDLGLPWHQRWISTFTQCWCSSAFMFETRRD